MNRLPPTVFEPNFTLERAGAGAADGFVPAGTGLQDARAEDVVANAVEVAADLQ